MEETIAQALKLIRDSEEIGVGTCSTIDECYSDEELVEEIKEEMHFGASTPEEILEAFIQREKTLRSYEADIQGA